MNPANKNVPPIPRSLSTQPPMMSSHLYPQAMHGVGYSYPQPAYNMPTGYPIIPGWNLCYTPEGAPYWYNPTTLVSTWEPPVPQPPPEPVYEPVPGEVFENWQLYKEKTKGRTYWKHLKTDEISKSIPAIVREAQREREQEKLQALAAKAQRAQTPPPELSEVPTEKKQRVDTPPRKVAAPLRHEKEERKTPPPIMPQAEQVYSGREDRVAAFTQMLEDKQIDPKAEWEAILPLVISDVRYTALKTAKDRKSVFGAYSAKMLASRKEAERQEEIEATAEIRNLLDGAKETLSYPLPFEKVEQHFTGHRQWSAVSPALRKKIVSAYMQEASKRNSEESRKKRHETFLQIGEILKAVNVTSSTGSSEALSKLESSKEHDEFLKSLSSNLKRDSLKEYQRYLDLQDDLNNMQQDKEERKRKRQLRRELREHLESEAEKGTFTCYTPYEASHEVLLQYTELKSDDGKRDIYNAVCACLARQYTADRTLLREWVKSHQMTDPTSYKLDDFASLQPQVATTSIYAFIASCKKRVQSRYKELLRYLEDVAYELVATTGTESKARDMIDQDDTYKELERFPDSTGDIARALRDGFRRYEERKSGKRRRGS